MEKKYVAYIGSYTFHGSSKGIAVMDVDVEKGRFIKRKEIRVNNSSYLTVSHDNQYLYSIVDEGVASFKILPDGNLKHLNTATIKGMRGCFLTTDSKNRFLVTGGYHDGKMTVLRLKENGEVGHITAEVFDKGIGSVAERNFMPHISCVQFTPDEKFLCMVDSGIDQVRIYRFDHSDGTVRINQKDVREYDLQQLRAKIGYVAQKAVLFRGSIADNIRFGKKDADEAELMHAAEVAQAAAFIQEKPHRFDERIVEGATNVSGGQKQRLSIARALVRRPQIYIYDDSFSALDFATDAKLRKELKKEVKDSIMMIVAQRVSTIMDADRIVVLDEGKVAGIGTHSELLKSCQIYHEIAVSQLSEEELAYGK